MSTSNAKLRHIGLILLSTNNEIEYVEPTLLQEVSSELKDWIGLGFQQWLSYAFACAIEVDPPLSEKKEIQIWEAEEKNSTRKYRFKRFSSESCSTIQISKFTEATPSVDQNLPTRIDAIQLDHLEDHWNRVMVWMGPGFLHDANNQMAALVTLAECLVGSPDIHSLPEDDLADIKWILKCGKESAAIFQLLTKVYRLEGNNYNYVDLRTLLNESAKLIEISLPNSVKTIVKNSHKELPARVSPKEFFQFLLGLMAQVFPDRNARPVGDLHLTFLSTENQIEHLECIADEKLKKETIILEIQFSPELSASFPTPNDLSHSPLENFRNLLDKNYMHALQHPENCGYLIGIPMSEAK